MAVSALEHVKNEAAFWQTVSGIRDGLRKDGVVCLVINTNVSEHDVLTWEALAPQFEVALQTQPLQHGLQRVFAGWQVLRSGVVRQRYEIPRGERMAALASDVVTYVARKCSPGFD